MTSTNQLEKLAIYAEQVRDKKTLKRIWELIVAKNPHDSLAWQQLGKIAFDDHNDDLAIFALDQFFQLYTPASDADPSYAESLYEYGAILQKKRSPLKARRYFKKSLCYLDNAQDLSYPMRELQALLLYKLNAQERNPIEIMQTIYLMSGNNPDVAADYANMLMDIGSFSKAEYLFKSTYTTQKIQKVEICE